MVDNVFRIDEDLQKKLTKKWSEFRTQVEDFQLGPNKIHIEKRIWEEFLNVDAKQAKEAFEGLCITFAAVCHDHQIECTPLNVFVVVEDELDRGVSVRMRDVTDGSHFGLILLAPKDFTEFDLWVHTFLHELGHCWLAVQLSEKELDCGELFIDLVAICALRKVYEPHKRVYREIIKRGTYFGAGAAKKLLGKSLNKQILENPESHLTEIWQRVKTT